MAVTDKKVFLTANHAKQNYDVTIITAVSQTNTKAGSWKPGYQFKILGVQVWCTAVTATLTVDVQITGVSVLTGQITPVAGSIVTGTLSATDLTLRGGASDTIDVLYTTGAAGAATNLGVVVTFRPRPLDNESTLPPF